MPLWLIALLFLLGIAWVIENSSKRLAEALNRISESLPKLAQPKESTDDESSSNKLAEALNEFTESLTRLAQPTERVDDDDEALPYEPTPTLGDQLVSLREGIDYLRLSVEKTECTLLPMALVAAYRFEKIGWGRFPELYRRMDKAVGVAEGQKRQRLAMRDHHGMPVLVYEADLATALEKGWTMNEGCVVISDAGPNKVGLIKVLRELNGLDLQEATELVEGGAKLIKRKLTKEQVASVKKRLEDAGARVQVSWPD